MFLIKHQKYGVTPEQRDLNVYFISSPENLANLEQIRNNNLAAIGLSQNKSQMIGLKKPNQFGLYDMFGNVWEWTQDCWNENYNGAPNDGRAWIAGNCSTKRVMRGGEWGSHPDGLRSAFRFYSSAKEGFQHLGIRVVRTP